MKRATIVGGSLTGLAAGILLRRIGWEVNIFERSSQILSDRGAGIVMQQETLEMLGLCGAKSDGDVGVRLTTRQYLAADGSVVSSQRMPQLMTSWGLLSRGLKRVSRSRTIISARSFRILSKVNRQSPLISKTGLTTQPLS